MPHSPFGRDKSNLFKLASMIMTKPLADCSRGGTSCAGAGPAQETRELIEKRENNKVVMEFEQNLPQKKNPGGGNSIIQDDDQIRDKVVKGDGVDDGVNGEFAKGR